MFQKFEVRRHEPKVDGQIHPEVRSGAQGQVYVRGVLGPPVANTAEDQVKRAIQLNQRSIASKNHKQRAANLEQKISKKLKKGPIRGNFPKILQAQDYQQIPLFLAPKTPPETQEKPLKNRRFPTGSKNLHRSLFQNLEVPFHEKFLP